MMQLLLMVYMRGLDGFACAIIAINTASREAASYHRALLAAAALSIFRLATYVIARFVACPWHVLFVCVLSVLHEVSVHQCVSHSMVSLCHFDCWWNVELQFKRLGVPGRCGVATLRSRVIGVNDLFGLVAVARCCFGLCGLVNFGTCGFGALLFKTLTWQQFRV